jgi:hypothetical protein
MLSRWRAAVAALSSRQVLACSPGCGRPGRASPGVASTYVYSLGVRCRWGPAVVGRVRAWKVATRQAASRRSVRRAVALRWYKECGRAACGLRATGACSELLQRLCSGGGRAAVGTPSLRQTSACSPGCGRPGRASPGCCGRSVRAAGPAGGGAQLPARGGRRPIAAGGACQLAGLRAPWPCLAGLLRAQRPRMCTLGSAVQVGPGCARTCARLEGRQAAPRRSVGLAGCRLVLVQGVRSSSLRLSRGGWVK